MRLCLRMAADSRIFTGLMLAGSVGLVAVVVVALVVCEQRDKGKLRSDEEYEGFRSCESDRSTGVVHLLLERRTLVPASSSMSLAFFAKPSALFEAVTVLD